MTATCPPATTANDVVAPDYDGLCKLVADRVASLVRSKPDAVLGRATGHARSADAEGRSVFIRRPRKRPTPSGLDGHRDDLDAREIVMMANGPAKAEIIPAALVHAHPNARLYDARLYLEESAASLLRNLP